ncbi:MAG: nucleotidyltransferase domain-containing protein [Thermoleophilia bacterium]
MAVSQDMLDRIVTSLVEEAQPERIVLFGSQARDEADEGSDIDLLVVEQERFGPERSRRREMVRLWRALPELTAGADILVYSSDEVERWRESRNHVIGRALREGRVLYERP